MGYIEKRRRSDGTAAWRARYRRPDGSPDGRTFDRKIDAERFLTTIEADKLRGSWVDPKAGRRSFREYAEEWRQMQVQHERSTADQIASHFANHVYPTFGDRPLASIRTSEVQAWVKGREDAGLAPATIETMYRHLTAVFNAAVADQLIGRSPCGPRLVKLPKADDTPVVPPTAEQVAALIAAAPDRMRGPIVLAAGSGMRQGEVLGLVGDRIEWLRRQVKVEQQLYTPQKGAPYLKRLKSKSARRTIPLPDAVLAELTAHVAAFPAGEDGLVFTNSGGRPWRRSRFAEAFGAVCVAAGLVGGDDKPLFTCHDLRHFYASVLIAAGLSVKVVQERLGHASARETLDTYAHLWPDDEDRTRVVVQGAFDTMLTNEKKEAAQE